MPPEFANPKLQLVLALVLGVLGLYLLLPKPKRRSVASGTFLLIAALAILGVFVAESFGKPVGQIVPDILFWLFATGAVGFGAVLVTQRNPARGAIAFAFVILSSCGLFLLLAAPFLMAATIIIYAGAIIVTFLFVLMLSHVKGPSNENDRAREPLLGSLAGLGFVGLILFVLLQAKPAEAATAEEAGDDFVLPAVLLTIEDRTVLRDVRTDLEAAIASEDAKTGHEYAKAAHDKLAEVIGGDGVAGKRKPVLDRLHPLIGDPKKPTTHDPRLLAFAQQTLQLQKANDGVEEKYLLAATGKADKASLQKLRDEVAVYSGTGQLPARNVSNIGLLLYSEHLLAVEMAGTLLLVATIGAVAIAGRKNKKGVVA